MDDGSENELEAYLSEMSKERHLNAEEEYELGTRMRAGDRDARDLFIRGSLHLALFIARRYQSQKVPLSDLIQEANYGLIQAADSWTPGRGRFSSYARWFIRGRVMQAFRAAHLVHLPNDKWQAAKQVRDADNALGQSLGREPSNTELCGATGLSEEALSGIRLVLSDVVALDYQPDSEAEPGAYSLSDSCEVAEEAMALAYVEDLLASLTPKWRTVIIGYAGLADELYTLAELGASLGVNGQTAAKYLAKARQQLAACVDRPAWADAVKKRSYGRLKATAPSG